MNEPHVSKIFLLVRRLCACVVITVPIIIVIVVMICLSSLTVQRIKLNMRKIQEKVIEYDKITFGRSVKNNERSSKIPNRTFIESIQVFINGCLNSINY